MLPTKRIRSWMSFQNLWRTAMKCQISRTSAPSLWRTACETAACRNHAKQRPRTMPKCCLRNALGAEWASKTFGGRLWNVKYQELAPQAFGGPLAKPPNSSRIRAETMRNSDHANSKNLPKRCLRNASKTSVPSLWRTACETAEQQQDSCQKCWMSFQNLWRAAMKCQTSKTSVQSLWPTASETAEQQQDSGPNHAKQRPRTMPKCCLRNALRAEWASKTFGGPLWNVKHQKLASKAFGGPLAKPPNSSRIRVQTMRNSDHAQCRNVAYETH